MNNLTEHIIVEVLQRLMTKTDVLMMQHLVNNYNTSNFITVNGDKVMYDPNLFYKDNKRKIKNKTFTNYLENKGNGLIGLLHKETQLDEIITIRDNVTIVCIEVMSDYLSYIDDNYKSKYEFFVNNPEQFENLI